MSLTEYLGHKEAAHFLGVEPPPITQAKRTRAEQARINGAKSNGPKTKEGKAKSGQNALKHGLTAQQRLALPTDEEGAYELFRNRILWELLPEGYLEEAAAERVVDCMWRLRRMNSLEATLIDPDPAEVPPAGIAFTVRDWPRAHINLSRYETNLDRSRERAMKELRQLQAERETRFERLLTKPFKLKARTYDIAQQQALEPPLQSRSEAEVPASPASRDGGEGAGGEDPAASQSSQTIEQNEPNEATKNLEGPESLLPPDPTAEDQTLVQEAWQRVLDRQQKAEQNEPKDEQTTAEFLEPATSRSRHKGTTPRHLEPQPQVSPQPVLGVLSLARAL